MKKGAGHFFKNPKAQRSFGMSAVTSLPPCFFRDLAEGLQQQMFFWGRDVLHPSDNLLVAQGFQRSPSTGIKGTSCYRREWQEGHLELYGSCAGWYGEERGFVFIRPKRGCFVWRTPGSTPVPGKWQNDLIDRKAGRDELYQWSKPFLDWLLSYEETQLDRFGPRYRENQYHEYARVPKTKSWLPPSQGRQWFRMFREQPDSLVRPKNLMRDRHG